MNNNRLACFVAILCVLSLFNIEVKSAVTINWNDYPVHTNYLPVNHNVPLQICPWNYIDIRAYGCIEIPIGGSHEFIQDRSVPVYRQSTNELIPVWPKPKLKVFFHQWTAIKPRPMLGMVALVHRRKVVLYNAPAYSVWHHPGGTTQLTALLRSQGHTVEQRYGHIIGLEYLLKSHGGQDVEKLIESIRGPNARPTLADYYAARLRFEEISRGIKTDDRFSYERNNIVYQAATQDGTIDGALLAIKNREKNLWYAYFVNVEVPKAKEFAPDVYGISTSDERQFIPGLVLASLIKEALPNTLVVLGGNIWPRVTKAFEDSKFGELFSNFDAIVYREGYEPLNVLVETLDPSTAAGTVWRDKGIVTINPPTAPPTEFQDLLTPHFDGGAEPWSPEPVFTLYTASNCHKRCGYCAISAQSDSHLGKPRSMTPRKIAEDMAKTGAHKFDIVDELFRYDYQLELGAELRRIGYEAEWQCYVTMEDTANRKLTDSDVAKDLYSAGCRSVQLGLESLDPNTLLRELKSWNKPQNYGTILSNFKNAGIHTHVFLIVGIPGEPLHVGFKWIGFLAEHADSILTIKSGRYRLMRLSPEEINGSHSNFITVLPATKPLRVNRDFTYLKTSNTKVDALRDILEQACRRHWAYQVTSSIPWWVNRSRFTWDEFREMADTAAKLYPPEPDVAHLFSDRLGQMRTVIRTELGLNANFRTWPETLAFARTLL